MTFKLLHQTDTGFDTVLIPLAAGDHLSKTLQQLASDLSLPADALKRDFKAEAAELLPLYIKDCRLLLVGLGKDPTFTDIQRSFRTFSHRYKERMPSKLAINWFYASAASHLPEWVEAAVNGLYLGGYQIGRYKSKARSEAILWGEDAQIVLQLPEAGAKAVKDAAEKAWHIATTQARIIDLVNAPSNKKLPSDLANWALRSGEKYGYQVEVYELKKIKSIGLHALLAVNRGSEEPPTFIVMEYQPENAPAGLPKVGLVGKGVTFDTGGLSIKPSANLHYMKSDMGGAAAVLGAMEAAAKLQLPVHLIGIVPATDNSVDARAIKPSDVIDSYSGKTIEIIDTDAEGRLILADGIAYALRHYSPDILIDLATLTGSAVRTFGYHAAGLFTNNEELYQRLSEAGERTGERLWRLPLWDVYKEDLKSDVADVRNYSGRPLAGAIGAAKFLEFFTEDHPAWAHLDIAGVAFSDSEFTTQKSATGFGLRLLIDYLSTLK